jgi:superfamily II DNA/RNA helicase
VVNYEIPNDKETYVHRIWRTARAGKKWVAIAFCTPHEKPKFEAIEKLINQKVEVITDESYKDVIVPKGKSEKLKKIDQKNKPRFQKWRRQYGKSAEQKTPSWDKKSTKNKKSPAKKAPTQFCKKLKKTKNQKSKLNLNK